jgi:hypothetical protein
MERSSASHAGNRFADCAEKVKRAMQCAKKKSSQQVAARAQNYFLTWRGDEQMSLSRVAVALARARDERNILNRC